MKINFGMFCPAVHSKQVRMWKWRVDTTAVPISIKLQCSPSSSLGSNGTQQPRRAAWDQTAGLCRAANKNFLPCSVTVIPSAISSLVSETEMVVVVSVRTLVGSHWVHNRALHHSTWVSEFSCSLMTGFNPVGLSQG